MFALLYLLSNSAGLPFSSPEAAIRFSPPATSHCIGSIANLLCADSDAGRNRAKDALDISSVVSVIRLT